VIDPDFVASSQEKSAIGLLNPLFSDTPDDPRNLSIGTMDEGEGDLRRPQRPGLHRIREFRLQHHRCLRGSVALLSSSLEKPNDP
jgi:hypothetical protein